MKHLFTYGTLMCNDIMAAVTGAQLSHLPATLAGYRRCCVKGEPYPAVIADAASTVAGALYMNMPRSAWPRLDRFEGDMYSREIVPVKQCDGSVVYAEVYLTRPEFTGFLLEGEWDFERFLRKYKSRYIRI